MLNLTVIFEIGKKDSSVTTERKPLVVGCFSFFSPRIRVKNSYNQLWLMKLRILPQIPINLIQILITFAHKKHSTLLPLFQVSFENPIIQKCSFNYNIDFASLLGVGLIQLVLIMCIEWSD